MEIESFVTGVKPSIETVIEENKPLATEKLEFENREKIIFLAIFSNHQDSEAKNKTDSYSIGWFNTC